MYFDQIVLRIFPRRLYANENELRRESRVWEEGESITFTSAERIKNAILRQPLGISLMTCYDESHSLTYIVNLMLKFIDSLSIFIVIPSKW